MRPKIGIFSFSPPWGPYMSGILHRIFGDEVETEIYGGVGEPIRGPVSADLILVSQSIVYYAARQFIDPNTPVVNLATTITKEQFDRIRAIPAGTRVLVVNDNDTSTIETIVNFQTVGLTHLDYHPYTRASITVEPQPALAITPGETRSVPDYIQTVVDIGQRVIDPQTLTEIAVYLGLEHTLKRRAFLDYLEEVCSFRNSLAYLLDRTTATSSVFLSLMDKLDEGVIVLDRTGLLQSCNRKAEQILGRHPGQHISQLLPCQLTQEFSSIQEDSSVQIVNLDGNLVSFRILPIQTGGDLPGGALVELNAFEEKERQQRLLRRRIRQQGHTAKRTFDDIVAISPVMQELKKTADKHARSSATILITGESGTGKEILAQAIHNASDRREGSFVALNCAALPRELLESELFGYEEGAFTGARKGGKSGMFELAHNGTIFLDEIGDMDLSLQARILRVLEEREVQRIGGDTTFPVDIRVIAATNQDLWKLMEEGRFRRDLYYRLSVVPLEIPPLRQRPEDVLPLFTYFSRQKGRVFALTPQAQQYLINYPWYGNVRELRNWVEYLSVLDGSHLDMKDLQALSHSWKHPNNSMPTVPAPSAGASPAPSQPQPEDTGNPHLDQQLSGFLAQATGEEGSYFLVLRALASVPSRGMGRHAIAAWLRERDHPLSDLEIRRVVAGLSGHGLVLQGAGRMGARITPLGLAALDRLRQDPCLGKVLQRLDN